MGHRRHFAIISAVSCVILSYKLDVVYRLFRPCHILPDVIAPSWTA